MGRLDECSILRKGTSKMQIEEKQIVSLQKALKEVLSMSKLPFHDIRLELANPKYWGVTLYVPSDVSTPLRTNNVVMKALYKLGVPQDYIAFFGIAEASDDYEWYFTHPEVPDDVMKMMESLSNAQEKHEDEILPVMEYPIPKIKKTDGDTCFLVMRKEYYEDIEKGYKTVEFRTLNQYYCDKFFGHKDPLRYVKFQLGYNTDKEGKPRQMTYEVKDILLFNDALESISARDEDGEQIRESEIKEGFCPTMYGLVLGNMIS